MSSTANPVADRQDNGNHVSDDAVHTEVSSVHSLASDLVEHEGDQSEVDDAYESWSLSNSEPTESKGVFLGIQKTAGKIKSRFRSSMKELKMKNKKSGQIANNEPVKKFAKNWIAITRSLQVKKKPYNSYRKAIKFDASKYRRGPIPVESLPSSDRYVNKTTHGTIDSDEEDYRQCLPSSRGLLVYFATLGQSTDEDESVDLSFVDSLLEAGANINHIDRLV